MKNEQKRKIGTAKRMNYTDMAKFHPSTWSATHIPDYSDHKQRCYGIHKKCLCCGKIYPVNTGQKKCDCEAHGHLYEAGYLDQERRQ